MKNLNHGQNATPGRKSDDPDNKRGGTKTSAHKQLEQIAGNGQPSHFEDDKVSTTDFGYSNWSEVEKEELLQFEERRAEEALTKHLTELNKSHPVQISRSEELTLLQSWKAGNYSAFTKLVDVFYIPVWEYARWLVASRFDLNEEERDEEAADIVNNTFEKILELHVEKRRGIDCFRDYLFGAVKKNYFQFLRTYGRTQKKNQKYQSHLNQMSNTRNLGYPIKAHDIMSLLKNKIMGEEEYNIFLMRYVSGMSQEQIAKELNRRTNTINGILYRSKIKVKNYLSSHMNFDTNFKKKRAKKNLDNKNNHWPDGEIPNY